MKTSCARPAPMMSEPTPLVISAGELVNRRVSSFKSVRNIRPCAQMTVSEFVQGVRGGTWRDPVEAVRAAFRVSKVFGDAKKKTLPAVAFSGLFEHRANDGLTLHSGLLCLDFDRLGDRQTDARRQLEQDPHVLAVFASPSGNGVKALVPVTATNADTHRACFKIAEDYFAGWNLNADPACKDVSRLCYASWDPGCWTAEPKACVLPFCLQSVPCTSALCTLHPTLQEGDGRVALARARAEARCYVAQIESSAPVLAGLYRQILADRFELGPHRRNQWLADAIPFIFRAFGKPVGIELALLHLRAYGGLYSGSESEHRASFDSLWLGCEMIYPAELSATERGIYDTLNEPERAAFRICRDLALRNAGLTFFLACDYLALRLTRPGEVNGWRLLRSFEKLGVVALVEKGHARAKGQRSVASSYRWTLPVLTPSTVAA